MKVIALAVMLALPTMGCASTNWGAITTGVSTVVNAKITQDQVDTARAAYVAGFLAPAAAYTALPRCTVAPAPCSDNAKVIKIKTITAAMRTNFNNVQAIVTNGGSGMDIAWSLLQSGLSTATALMGS